jgi:hypothetical protein
LKHGTARGPSVLVRKMLVLALGAGVGGMVFYLMRKLGY